MHPDSNGEVLVPSVALEVVRASASAARPEEACGVLSGARADIQGASHWTVEQAHPMANVAGLPRSAFCLDPVELLHVTRAVEAAGRDVVGIFHSHPNGPPVPSATDVEAAELMPAGWCHLLVGDDGGDGGAREGRDAPVRAWQLGGGQARELEVRVTARGRPAPR